MVADYRAESRPFYRAKVTRRYETLGTVLLVAAILYVFLRTFTLVQAEDPYLPGSITETQSAVDAVEGNLLNRLIWLIVLSGVLPLLWRFRHRCMVLASGNLLLLVVLAFCLASVSWAIDPAISFRRYAELLITTVFTIGIVVTLPSPWQFLKAALIASSILIVLDLAIIPAMPWLAFNYLWEFEGVHKHKNLAGAFFLLSGILWLFSVPMFRTWPMRIAGACVFLLVIALLLMTQSKTSIALLPLSIVFAVVIKAASGRGRFWFALMMCFILASVLTATLPLGLVSPLAIIDDLYGDVTFTGRTRIWAFMVDQIERYFWTGAGYGSFWGIGDLSPNLRSNVPLITVVGQAHNGYLDVAVTIGVIGLVLALALVLAAFRRLFAISADPGADDMNGRGVAIMVAILVAGLIHNVTESSLLRSAHPIWFFMLFAILYLSVIEMRVRDRIRQRPVTRLR